MDNTEYLEPFLEQSSETLQKDEDSTNFDNLEETSFTWMGRINFIASITWRFFYCIFIGLWTWVYMSVRMLLFVLFLIPGWIVMLFFPPSP